jgi:FkbM family methyltransferase
MRIATLRLDDRAYQISGDDQDITTIAMLDGDGNYEPWLIETLRRVLPADAVSIDVGANIGIIAAAIAHFTPEGRVYAFEPHPTTFACLQQTLAMNRLDAVTAYDLALGRNVRQAQISCRNHAFGDAKTDSVYVGGGHIETLPVRMTALDVWVRETGLSRIDFIKIDIEGGEIDFLHGAEETLRACNPDIAIEWNLNAQQERAKELYDLLKKNFHYIYLMDRLQCKLVPVSSYAALRGMCLTGPRVDDLFCTNRRSPHLSAALASRAVAATWTAAVVEETIAEDGDGVAPTRATMFNVYADGWVGGREGYLIIETPAATTLRLTFDTHCDRLKTSVCHEDLCDTLELTRGVPAEHKIDLPAGISRIFIESDRDIAAADIWGNTDPRRLSLRLLSWRIDPPPAAPLPVPPPSAGPAGWWRKLIGRNK